ncbi:MAG TPA: NAD(P)H-hydrate dehydratase [Vicinamibacteria bacterium]
MKPVLTAAEMREADRRTIDEIGLPGVVLMENAGRAVARAARRRWPAARRIAVLCGRGNNGGDGFVAARCLPGRATAYLLGRRDDVQGDARVHMLALERSGAAPLVEIADAAAWAGKRGAVLDDADLVVDALLGTGMRSAPTGVLAEAIGAVNARRAARGLPVLAVDLPSGIPADGGEVPGPALSADLTVTFAARKPAHVLPPASREAGRTVVADIGIPFSLLAQAQLWRLERADAAAAFPPRDPDAHKGRFGHVLVVAGSTGKSGAAALAGEAALLSGAGLVTVACPEAVLAQVAAARPELMTAPLAADAEGALAEVALEPALALVEGRDAVVLGPGLGTAAGTRSFVQGFVRRCPAPLVIDADGLNALAGAAGALPRGHATVLTPHPGEMARLAGLGTAEVQSQRLATARAFAARSGAVVVLKGHATLVAQPDGPAAVNATGGPAMATGGTGDVLAGIIGALLARGLEAWPAACAAAYVHGWAGDEGARRLGDESLTAGGLLEALPRVLRRLERSHRRA